MYSLMAFKLLVNAWPSFIVALDWLSQLSNCPLSVANDLCCDAFWERKASCSLSESVTVWCWALISTNQKREIDCLQDFSVYKTFLSRTIFLHTTISLIPYVEHYLLKYGEANHD